MEFTKLSTEIEKTVQDINLNLDKIVHRPLIKRIIYKVFPKNEFKDLEIALSYLYEKRNYLTKYLQILEKLNVELEEENKELQKQIDKIESSPNIDIELLVNLRTKFVENSELLTNQIPILIELIGTTLTKLEKALPFIERTIKNRLTINTSLKALNLLIDNVIELENYSKELEKIIHFLPDCEDFSEIKNLKIELIKKLKNDQKVLVNYFIRSKFPYVYVVIYPKDKKVITSDII